MDPSPTTPRPPCSSRRRPKAASSSVTLPKNVATHSDVDSAKTVGIIGVVVGAIALIVAVVALFTRRRAA